MENMICPKCGQFQKKAETCSACGVIVEKLRPQASAAPSEGAPAARAKPDGQDSVDQTKGELPRVARVAIAAVLIAAGIGMVVGITPKKMTIDEFVEAKKSSIQVRPFKIEGIVEPDRSFIRAQASDGRELSSLKITADDTSGYITFDPSDISQTPSTGDLVRVTGRFQSVPYFDGRSVHKKITLALASSIRIIRAAAADGGPETENQ